MEVQALIEECSTVVFTRSSSPSYVRNSACACTYIVQDATVCRLYRSSTITKSVMGWNNNRTELRLKINVGQLFYRFYRKISAFVDFSEGAVLATWGLRSQIGLAADLLVRVYQHVPVLRRKNKMSADNAHKLCIQSYSKA